jgi:hypothetical protein
VKLTAEQLDEHRAAIADHYADDVRVGDTEKFLGYWVPVVKAILHTQIATAEQDAGWLVTKTLDFLEAHGDPKIEAHLKAIAPQIVDVIETLSHPKV